MRITFMGSKSSKGISSKIEFGSKYEQKLSPELYRKGKELTKEIAKNKGLLNPELIAKVADRKYNKEEWRTVLNGIQRNMPRHSYNTKGRAYANIIDRHDTETRQERIKELSEKAKARKKNNTPFVKERVVTPKNTTNLEPLIEKRNIVIREQVIPPKSTNTFSPNKQNVGNVKATSNTQLLTPKSGMGMKLGLGAVGLAATGAIGYGIYRKIRSDKNKKRGSYRK